MHGLYIGHNKIQSREDLLNQAIFLGFLLLSLHSIGIVFWPRERYRITIRAIAQSLTSKSIEI